jgi:hypothetical protein
VHHQSGDATIHASRVRIIEEKSYLKGGSDFADDLAATENNLSLIRRINAESL